MSLLGISKQSKIGFMCLNICNEELSFRMICMIYHFSIEGATGLILTGV